MDETAADEGGESEETEGEEESGTSIISLHLFYVEYCGEKERLYSVHRRVFLISITRNCELWEMFM